MAQNPEKRKKKQKEKEKQKRIEKNTAPQDQGLTSERKQIGRNRVLMLIGMVVIVGAFVFYKIG